MHCPKCCSNHLDIRQPTGFEPVMIFLTNKRKFRCRECLREFRAPDRRRKRREMSEAYTRARVAGALR
jgi:hypothetical protein